MAKIDKVEKFLKEEKPKKQKDLEKIATASQRRIATKHFATKAFR